MLKMVVVLTCQARACAWTRVGTVSKKKLWKNTGAQGYAKQRGSVWRAGKKNRDHPGGGLA